MMTVTTMILVGETAGASGDDDDDGDGDGDAESLGDAVDRDHGGGIGVAGDAGYRVDGPRGGGGGDDDISGTARWAPGGASYMMALSAYTHPPSLSLFPPRSRSHLLIWGSRVTLPGAGASLSLSLSLSLSAGDRESGRTGERCSLW